VVELDIDRECSVGRKGPCPLQLFQPDGFVVLQSTTFDLCGLAVCVLIYTVSSVWRVVVRMPYLVRRRGLERRRGSAPGSVGETGEVMEGITELMECLDVGLVR
jgi:hypothetical protein